MGDKLLIRAYNVGCGDCIYVRIPNKQDGFHILIDCGSKGEAQLLKKAIRNLASLLPAGSRQNSKRLDLLVATHRHEDHIKGFDPASFKDIEVKHIWMSKVMDPSHPQARKVNQMHSLARQVMRGLAASGQALNPEVELLAALYHVSNEAADNLLMTTLPKANNIKPHFVHAGQTGKELGLKLEGAEIHVLAPERDIDGYYLGKAADQSLRTLQGTGGLKLDTRPKLAAGAAPKNISAADFRRLRSRMLSNGLAFAAKDTSIQNNMSVVLLIEWQNRRLLFVGDAEWHGEYRIDKQNGSWNVMWENHRKTHLKKPVDFLKVGHHGSINATPPPAAEKPKPGKNTPPAGASIYDILDVLLPVPKSGKPTAQALVSTEREFYTPIPECKLLVDLARRVKNTRNYGKGLKAKGIDAANIWVTEKARREKFFERFERDFLEQPQPLRTDLEFALTGQDFIDIEIEGA